MSNIEITQRFEQEIPPSYELIPELFNAESVMRQQAKDFAQAFLMDPNKDIIIPLNGGIIPFYYTMEHFFNRFGLSGFEILKNRAIFTQVINEDDIRYSRKNSGTSAYMIDDIADTLTLAKIMRRDYPENIQVFASVQKTITSQHLVGHEEQLTIHTPLIVENKWIASSAGMDEGAENDYLSTLQRFAKTGFFKRDNTMTDLEKIDFFKKLLLPGFSTDDELFITCMYMEYYKRNGFFSDQMIITSRLIDRISRHIGERSLSKS